MNTRLLRAFALLLLLALLFGLQPPLSANADVKVTGGVVIHSVLPKKICMGDTITINGGASVTGYSDEPPIAWLPVTTVKARATLGQISPNLISQFNDGFYFTLTYKATQPGKETIYLTANDTVASTQESFEVEEKCDYDVFYTSVLHFTADMGDEQFESLTTVSGTGQMKRDRQGSEFYQGDGKYHLEETVLSKPSICVEYYSPPLIYNGPFELDGHLADEGETVDVILSFLPNIGAPTYHGETICVDEEGETGYGWGYAQGGDPALASTVESTFPITGGSQAVEMKGEGLNMVQSVGDLDYTATMTLIQH